MKYNISLTNYHLTLQAVNEDLTPMGYLSILLERDEYNNVIGKLMGLIRHPEFKDLEVCRSLTEKAIDVCKSLDVDKIYIGIYKKRKGYIKLLKFLGFEEIECDSKNHRRFVKKV